MKLYKLLEPHSIIIPLEATNKKQAIQTLTRCICQHHTIDKSMCDSLFDLVWEREQLASTSIGNGVAVPHCISQQIDEVLISFGRTPDKIEFSSLDGQQVDLIFLVIIPKGQVNKHLYTLRTIANLNKKRRFRDQLYQLNAAEDIIDLIKETEKEL